jgi:hypothetical protein
MQLVDQPCTTLNFVVGFEIHHQRPQLAGFHILDDESSCQPITRQKKSPWFLANTIRKEVLGPPLFPSHEHTPFKEMDQA